MTSTAWSAGPPHGQHGDEAVSSAGTSDPPAPPEHSNLPRGATFRGNLLSRLTLVERSQPEGVAIVEGVEFAEDSTTLITTSGHRIRVPAWSTSEEIHEALAAVMLLAPLDTDCWQSFPYDMTPWAIWLTLHYDLASLEGHLDDNVPGLHLVAVQRDGELARIVTGLGDERFRHGVPLTEQPLAIPVDLAFEVARLRR
ncbi:MULTISPECIES: hypothetical protein [Clavibacter]|nr:MULTISPECIES: hypothetical protein [Clavibacter]UKF24790.1 hypothetical protein KYT88_13885 [Clavibacter sp. A6099]